MKPTFRLNNSSGMVKDCFTKRRPVRFLNYAMLTFVVIQTWLLSSIFHKNSTSYILTKTVETLLRGSETEGTHPCPSSDGTVAAMEVLKDERKKAVGAVPEAVSDAENKERMTNYNAAKTPLYLITPSSRPSLLTKGIFHVLPLFQCFDVHWIIVHTAAHEQISKAPLFRNVFPWITEMFTYNEQSTSGNHERNIGIKKVLSLASHGLVYFLDDDNILPVDICEGEKSFSSKIMYYADQSRCGKLRLKTDWVKDTVNCTQGKCAPVNYILKVDSGTFLTPIWLLRQHGLQWRLKAYRADGIFFTDVVNALLQEDGNGHRLEQLPSLVKFRYNELNDANGCVQWRAPWSQEQLHESLHQYRNLVDEMRLARESFGKENKMGRSEVSFHDYVHILHVLRYYVTTPNATYVEIGVWKGGTSIFMSRHPLHTNVIGIDGFFYNRQRNEAEKFRQSLQGDGNINWLKSDSKLAIPELVRQLNGKEIDIMFIDGDHSLAGARKDFELYAPLVANGGFIVFDDFLDTSFSGGVREAIMHLIRDGDISLEKYDVIGSVQNIMGAGPVFVDDHFFYDWQNVTSNEFIIRKRAM